jgi:hypothetical protein
VVKPPRDRPSASRRGLTSDLVSFGSAPCADLGGREDLRVDVGRRQVASAGGVLMRAHHPGVDAYRPR